MSLFFYEQGPTGSDCISSQAVAAVAGKAISSITGVELELGRQRLCSCFQKEPVCAVGYIFLYTSVHPDNVGWNGVV